MAGRHRASGRGANSTSRKSGGFAWRWRRVWLPAVIVLPLIVAAGMLRAETASDACAGHETVEVIADPDIATALEKAASAWTRSGEPDGVCADIRVIRLASAAAAARLAGDHVDLPDVWVPDSFLWVQRLRQNTTGKDTPAQSAWVSPSIASSPLVLAASPSEARSLVEPAAGGWSKVLSGQKPLAIPDPATSTEGLLTLATAEAALGKESGTPTPTMVSSLVGLSTRVVGGTAEAVKSAGSRAFTASEQAVIQANSGAGPAEVQAVYPRGGSMSLDFPIVQFVPPTQAPVHRDAVRAYVSSLYEPATQRDVRALGLRNADGDAFASTVAFHGVAPTGVVQPLPRPNDKEMVDALRVWSAANRRNRTLVVVDVSGSMAEGRGEKIRFAAAAAGDAVGYLPEDAQLGLWAFSTDLKGTSPWRQLVSLGALGPPDDRNARRQALRTETDRLPVLAQSRGDTGLYTTTWDAYRTVRDGYDPRRYNSVVLVTDGANTTHSGLTRTTLLGRLRAAEAPSRPLPISTVAIGPDADRKTLKQISAVTGGSEYTVDTPSDIREVFLDAVIREGT